MRTSSSPPPSAIRRSQDVPFSINAQTEEDDPAVRRGDARGSVAQRRRPRRSRISGRARARSSVRGVSAGQVVRDQPGVKEQVGVYLDETVISLSLFTPDLDLFDLNRVETLRGPQGTLFGSGSVGGTMRYITNQPNDSRDRGHDRGQCQSGRWRTLRRPSEGRDQYPAGRHSRACARSAITRAMAASSTRCARAAAASEDVNNGERYGGRIAVLFEPTERTSRSPRASSTRRSRPTASTGRRCTISTPILSRPRGREVDVRRARSNICCWTKASRDETMIGRSDHRMSSSAASTLTSVTSYTDRDILVSRDASALTGSVSVDLGFPDRRRAAAVQSGRHDRRLSSSRRKSGFASTGSGPFQWLVGGFYSNTDREYRQRLPTPGYDAVTDAVLGAGTSAAVANGFAGQFALQRRHSVRASSSSRFSARSATSFDPGLTATARRPLLRLSRKSGRFTSGGLFANGDDNRDRTASEGFTPRVMLSYEVAPNGHDQCAGGQGFPPRRRQRSAQPAAV